MNFTYFTTVMAQRGELCTRERFIEVTGSSKLAEICNAIANEPDHEKQQMMKKKLPIITFNAHFEGQRKNELAKPSGAYMYDGDGIEDPHQFFKEHILSRVDELGIMYVGMTPSHHGLRIVAKCRKEFSTIAECQQWLGDQIGWPCDAACKDWARASYVVPQNYIFYMDPQGMFEEAPEVVYDVKNESVKNIKETTMIAKTTDMVENESTTTEPTAKALQTTFMDIPLKDIAHQWLIMNGGEPTVGERNERIHKLAFIMKSITNNNEEVLMAALPRYGLKEKELRQIVHSACSAEPTQGIPPSLRNVLQNMTENREEGKVDLLSSIYSVQNSKIPPLPPIVKQYYKIAPEDFKRAAILCMLPLLGTLGSKLRAEYLDGKIHSPSFQVSLEAPLASGKSFIMNLSKELLKPIFARDREALQIEADFREKAIIAKNTNKGNAIGSRPKVIVRNIVPTISNTQLLNRLYNSQELHLICVAPEIDTVYKANKQSFSNYNDLLRVAFDNDVHGQDYYNPTDTFSGSAKVYLNTLFSGTPGQIQRFYPDVENGLVSRVLFVSIPDQFGKPIPLWGKMTQKSIAEVEKQVDRLAAICIKDDTVQPEYVMKLGFLNNAMKQWLEESRLEAIRTTDRTRDTFQRRAAVVGFRAGMLAYFLYGEKKTKTCRKNTVEFAKWVADQMLMEDLLRFEITNKKSYNQSWGEVYGMLNNEFTRKELAEALKATGSKTSEKHVISKWHSLGCIEDIETDTAANGKPFPVRFRKQVIR